MGIKDNFPKIKNRFNKVPTNKSSFKIPRINKQVAGIILLLILSISAGFIGGYFGSRNDSASDSSQMTVISREGELISQIAKKVGPSVVSVDVESRTTRDSLFGPQDSYQRGAGTGVIVSEDGVIVTNRHVVPEGVKNVAITLSDGTELDDVSVVGRTSNSDSLDIAFLKVNDTKGKKLSPAKIGNSSKVQVGDRVVAIGNALGQFQNTVTSGIISGFGRDIQAQDQGTTENLQDLFQTDAAINQGNSGGPLVNMQGEVIGINTAIAGDAQNIGFAIPINDVTGLIKSVLEKGELQRPYLGVRYIPLNEDYAYQLNLDTKQGAYVFSSSGEPSILPDSPAAKAGLKEKDTIIKVDGTEINERTGLSTLLAQKRVGDAVELTVIRDGQEIKLKVTLETAPNN